jgi:hypothetical protein
MTLPRPHGALARARRALAVLALLGAGLSASGATCGTTETIEPEVEPADHRMVIMPMKDRLEYHFDSRRGATVAQTVTDHLARKHKELGGGDAMEVVPFEDLVAEVGKVRKDPKDLRPADIGRMVKADLVLVGDLERFETRIPGDVAIARGRATVNLKLIEVAKPDRAMFTKKLIVTYPEEGRTNPGIMLSADAGEDAVEAGLLEAVARKVAELFYVHEKPVERGQ